MVENSAILELAMVEDSSRVFPLNEKKKRGEIEEDDDDTRDFVRSPHVWVGFRVRVRFGNLGLSDRMKICNV